MTRKKAVVLFNLGGPDSLNAVRPFLFNLFNDPAIIGVPRPIRWALARYISSKRAPIARKIYSYLGGKSPLLEQTQAQANALSDFLNSQAHNQAHNIETKVFICMRYWHPMTAETVTAVKAYAPDDIVLFPLYPQYSRSTSGSSLRLWHEQARRQGLQVPTRTVCCWPTEAGFIKTMSSMIADTIDRMMACGKKPRVLLSAHGLPKKSIASGDPYQWQVEQTASAIVQELSFPDLDWLVCYQSRVGPLEWIGPATEDEIQRAGTDKIPLIVVPLAFVSEHSETLVELDIEYRELADEVGVPAYERLPTVGINPRFVAGMAKLVNEARAEPCPINGMRLCPGEFAKCPCGIMTK